MQMRTLRPLRQSVWMMQARLLRRSIRRLGQQARYRRFSLEGVPILFANSFPKSGTHLLTQILQAFTELGPAVDSGLPAVVMYEGDSARLRSEEEILLDLRRFLPGDIGYGHLHYSPAVAQILSSVPFATFFVLRDPRDVAVSHVHYVTEMEPRHAHHHYFAKELSSFEERLTATIRGFQHISPPLPSLADRLTPYLKWLEEPGVLTLRYEELLLERQPKLEEILRKAVQQGFPLSQSLEAAVQILESRIQPHRSPTFRRGKIGSWRDAFTAEHKRLFKETCGGILERLGYEKDDDW